MILETFFKQLPLIKYL